MRQKPVSSAPGTKYEPGQCFVMDVFTLDESAIGWQKDATVGINVGSDKPFVFLINSKAGLHRYIDKVGHLYLGNGHVLRVLRVNKAFVMIAATEYCRDHVVKIKEPAPYEHAQLIPAEGLIHILSDKADKLLYRTKENTKVYKRLWSMALMEAVRLRGMRQGTQKPGDSLWLAFAPFFF